MKEQSNENPISKYDEVEHLKCKKRFYRYEDTEKSIYLSKKRFLNLNNNHNNNSQKLNGRFNNNNEFNSTENEQDEETLIRETQAALKSLSGSWSESNTISETIETDESPTFPNLFEEKNGSRKMSPATAPPLNSNYDLSSYRDLYSHNNNNGKPKSVIQSKKPRPNDEKFQSHDFNELLVDDGTDDHHQHSNKMSKSEKNDSVAYEMNSGYRMPSTPFSIQSSAFRPPLFDGIKKSNTTGSMPLSVYQYTDPNGGYYEKPFAKDDEMNAHDSKEYTTLQPAGIGSKAASVIQDIARDGVALVSVVSNSTARNPPTTHSNTERTFIERPAFSPGSTNKGKLKSQKD